MKTARQWFRAVKTWGVGDETKCTRRDFTRFNKQTRELKRWFERMKNE